MEKSPLEDGYRMCQDTNGHRSAIWWVKSNSRQEIPQKTSPNRKSHPGLKVKRPLSTWIWLKQFIPKRLSPGTSRLKFPDFRKFTHRNRLPSSAARVQASGAGLGNPYSMGRLGDNHQETMLRLSRTKGMGSCYFPSSDSGTHHEWKPRPKITQNGVFKACWSISMHLMARVNQTKTHHKSCPIYILQISSSTWPVMW